MNYRKGENEKTWFRMDRFFTIGAEWYATTREGRDLGPFKTRLAAEQGLVQYIIALKNNRKPQLQVARPANHDVWKMSNYI